MINMANLERTYNVPLRKGFINTPKYKRAKKAVNTLRLFLQKHMKSKDVKIGKYLNLKLWERGIKNPPHHVLVNATKDDKGVVKAELVGAPVEKKAEEKKGKKEAKKTEEKKPETKEEVKKAEEKKGTAKTEKKEVKAEQKTPEKK